MDLIEDLGKKLYIDRYIERYIHTQIHTHTLYKTLLLRGRQISNSLCPNPRRYFLFKYINYTKMPANRHMENDLS